MTSQRDNRMKVSAFLRGEMQKSLSVAHNCLHDQEAHGRWQRCQQTWRQWSKDVRCLSNGILQAIFIGVKQKPDNKGQIIKIVTKNFIQVFLAHAV